MSEHLTRARTLLVCLSLASPAVAEEFTIPKQPLVFQQDDEHGKRDLLRLGFDGVLWVDWPAIGEFCKAGQSFWDNASATLCVAWAIHNGQVRDMKDVK